MYGHNGGVKSERIVMQNARSGSESQKISASLGSEGRKER